MLSSILTPENTQALLQIVGSVVGLLLSAVLVTIRQKTGVQIRIDEEIEIDRLRERLADAIYNGTIGLISQKPDAPRDEQVDAIIEYLNIGLADTMTKLGVSDDILRARVSGAVAREMKWQGRQESAAVADGQDAAGD